MLSILCSSFNRLPLITRMLRSIANFPPSYEYEVIIADENSKDDILGELKKYSSVFPWKFIKVDISKFEYETGIKKFFNNPSLTNNVAFAHSKGDIVVLQGNEVLTTPDAYNRLIKEDTGEEYQIKFTTTFDIPESIMVNLDKYGTNFYNLHYFNECIKYPLASPLLHTDVTNYLCMITRPLWEKLGGFNEEYVCGIGKEDSDFIRRCRKIPEWKDEKNMIRSMTVSFHQSHKGRTMYYFPPKETITQERWREGEILSKQVWDRWDQTCRNPQPWEPGTLGVIDVISNV